MINFFRKSIPIVVVVIVTAVIIYFLNKNQQQFTPRVAEEQVWLISAMNAEIGSYQPVQTLYAKLNTERVTRLITSVSAEVSEVSIASGEFVSVGDTMVRLDEKSLNNSIARIESKLAQTELEIKQNRHTSDDQQQLLQLDEQLLELQQSNLARIRELASLQNSSVRDLEIATENYLNRQLQVMNRRQMIADLEISWQRLQQSLRSVQVDLDDAREDLARTRIISPVDGLVVQINVQAGSRVVANSAVAEILPADAIEFEALLINRQLPTILQSLENNQSVTATVELFGESFQAQLVRLKGVSDVAGQVGVFRVSSVNSDVLQRIRPNQIVPLRLNLPKQNESVLIPFSSIYGMDKVYVVRNDRLNAVDVDYLGSMTTINDDLPWAVIRSTDIQTDDRILITRLPNAHSGMKVTEVE